MIMGESPVPLDRVLFLLADISDMRDLITGSHGRRVAAIARLISEKLNLNDIECEIAYYAGLVHDIGKFAVPELILLKPGKLTDMEYGIIKNHAIFTRRLLERIINRDSPYFVLAKYASQHHERLDGSGYPDGVDSSELSIVSRIIAVADIFDVIIAKRLYEQQNDLRYACSELENAAKENKIDQDVVNALFRVKIVDILNLIDDKNLGEIHIDDISGLNGYTIGDICDFYDNRSHNDIIKKFEYYYYGHYRHEAAKF